MKTQTIEINGETFQMIVCPHVPPGQIFVLTPGSQYRCSECEERSRLN